MCFLLSAFESASSFWWNSSPNCHSGKADNVSFSFVYMIMFFCIIIVSAVH
jgi:hypothetical protein